MQNHLTDLDELLEGVRNDRSQEYISEAIRTYRAGAYRSAIIATWVAVCIDIIDKIRELSAEKDGKAKNLETELDGLKDKPIDYFLRYENSLLENAENNLNIISNNESRLLQRIKEDRNFCAHPDFLDNSQGEQITAEGARAHIVNACNALLHHAPIKGRVLIERVVSLVDEKSFSTNAEKAQSVLESEYYLGRAQKIVFRNLTIVFIKTIFQVDALSYDKGMRIFAALQAISNLDSNTYKRALKDQLNLVLSTAPDNKLRRIFLLPQLWSYIDNPIKQKIMGLIPSLSADDIINYRIYIFTESISEIKPTLDIAFEALGDTDKLKVIADSPTKEFKTLAITTFIHSGSFAGAYQNGRDYLLPHAQYFDATDLARIMDGTLENKYNQILYAAYMDAIFTALFNKTKHNIANHADLWSKFWNDIKSNNSHNFPTLSELLIENHIIPVEPVPPVPPLVVPPV